MTMMSLFYTVQKGDTLGKIARQNGSSVAELCKINCINDPDRIEVGQKIALKAEAVLNVGCQLLDIEWNPIPNAKMLFEYCGKKEEFSSGSNGRIPDITTDSPEDVVKIFIARADGTWKKITEVYSDWGNKLVTLVSPKLRIPARTMPHPKDSAGIPVREQPDPDRKPVTQPEHPKDAQAKGKPISEFGDGKGVKAEDTKTQNGAPVKKITKDQVALDFLGGYTGEKITDADYEIAAKELGCEVATIKAVAYVESRKAPFIDKKNWPTILYERHKFHKYTKPKGKYDNDNSDISSKKRYKKADDKNKKLVKKGQLKAYDLYGASYPRLAKAYALDKTAALKACSWGKFQIMGFNYNSCGYSSVNDFVKAMCTSEKLHLVAFVNFVKSNALLKKAAKDRDWANFALNYNGDEYEENEYDKKMKDAYEKFKK